MTEFNFDAKLSAAELYAFSMNDTPIRVCQEFLDLLLVLEVL